MTGSAPQGKRNCVLRCDSGTVSKNRDCGANRSTLWQVNGVLDSATNVTGGGSLVNLSQKRWDAGYLRRVSMLPRERRCECYCHCASDSFRMTVSRNSRPFGLLNDHVKIVGQIGTQRINSHPATIPNTTLAFKQRF